MANPSTKLQGSTYLVAVWSGETGTGGSLSGFNFSDKTIAFTGTGTVEMEGSMDGTTWFTLNDSGGNPIATLAANTPVVILENPVYIRPIVTGGTATIYVTAVR